MGSVGPEAAVEPVAAEQTAAAAVEPEQTAVEPVAELADLSLDQTVLAVAAERTAEAAAEPVAAEQTAVVPVPAAEQTAAEPVPAAVQTAAVPVPAAVQTAVAVHRTAAVAYPAEVRVVLVSFHHHQGI